MVRTLDEVSRRRNYRHLTVLVVLLSFVALQGCARRLESSDAAVSAVRRDSASTSGAVRQTDDAGRRLPFETTHAHRWNSRNDGTPYEPCTAIGLDDLAVLGLDEKSVRDAAGTDGQTLRGCAWTSETAGGRPEWSMSQFVGDSESLASDKSRKSTSIDIWLSDVVLDGRAVGVHRTTNGLNCDTYVQSGGAAVNTLVMHHGSPHPAPEEICAKAIEFTRVTIGKMPR